MNFYGEKFFSGSFTMVIVFLILQIGLASGRNRVQFKGIKCAMIEKKVGEFKACNMKIVKRDVIEINVYVKIFQKPIKDLSVHVKAHRRGFEHGKPMIDFTINLCTFYRNEKHNPIAELLLNVLSLKSYSNLNHTCPFNHDVIIDKYRFNEEYLRLLPFTVGNWRFGTIWSVSGQPMATVNIDVEMKEV